MNDLIRWAGQLLPPRFVGALEYYVRPGIGEIWGGPFNGQRFRQRVVTDLLISCEPAAIVETGTYRGSSTRFLATNSQAPVFSTEANPRNFGFASRRLQHFQNVTLFFMDSRELLKTLKLSRDILVFFYLDAHWGQDLPLQEETDLILKRFPNFLIMIDDFQVPDDPGYTFDDYGPGKSLTLTDFPFHQDERVLLYFPNCPSDEETGTRRGCILLAAPFLSGQLAEIASLRPYNSKTPTRPKGNRRLLC